MSQAQYEFTNDWFARHVPAWKRILAPPRQRPSRVLEIGSFEGQSTVWTMENLLAEQGGLIVAVDPWEEGPGAPQKGMQPVEARFDRNISIAARRFPTVRVEKNKGPSTLVLSALVARGEKFDFIYVDGDHRAPQVLTDMVLAFHLCKVNGLIFCDDYLHMQHLGLVESPKLAIDAFTTCFHFQTRIFPEWLVQLYLEKVAD